jgi:uncharacterized protein involved in exopolysaccharide biosynthesis
MPRNRTLGDDFMRVRSWLLLLALAALPVLAAVRAVQADPQYVAEAARLKLELSPVGAEEVVRAIERIGAASPDTLDYMRKLLTNSGGG